MVAYKKRELVT